MREQNRLPAFPITGLPANSGTLKPSGVPDWGIFFDLGAIKPSDVPDCVGGLSVLERLNYSAFPISYRYVESGAKHPCGAPDFCDGVNVMWRMFT